MENLVNIQGLNTKREASLKLSTTGKLLIGLTGGVGLALTVICVPFVSPALRKFCLPYIPATDTQIRNVLAAIQPGRGKLIDLGSGDGRIVLETARGNLEAHGVELNPWLVLYSKISAYKSGLSGHTRFYKRDLWKFDISGYDNVVIFGVEQMMEDLEKKILAECKKDCKVVACRFPLPSLTPLRTIGCGVDTVWLYEVCK